MVEHPIWEHESSRAVEVLGGEPTKYYRNVYDKVEMKFTIAEWQAIFNLRPEFKPCDSQYSPYDEKHHITIYFVRRHTEGSP